MKYTTTWMNLRIIIRAKRSNTERERAGVGRGWWREYMNENTINTQSRSVVAWGQKGRTGNDGREGLKELMGMFITSTVGMISHMYT